MDFVWTTALVMRALDAGIPEVISMFNTAYLSAWVNGVGRNIIHTTPIFDARRAYALAFEQTAATLNALESIASYSEEAMASDYNSDIDTWELVTDFADNFGIERGSIPMFSATV